MSSGVILSGKIDNVLFKGSFRKNVNNFFFGIGNKLFDIGQIISDRIWVVISAFKPRMETIEGELNVFSIIHDYFQSQRKLAAIIRNGNSFSAMPMRGFWTCGDKNSGTKLYFLYVFR